MTPDPGIATGPAGRFPGVNDGSRPPGSVVARTLWLLFTLFIVYGGTIPFHFAGDTRAILDKLRSLPLNPLVSPDTGGRLSIPDVVQNVLLFVPFGVLGFLAGRQARAAGPGAPLRRIAVVTALGAALSITVESLQMLTSDRVASLGDVMADTAGTCLGAAVAWQFRALFLAGLRRLRAEGLADVPELRPFAIATAVLAIAAWQPFDVTLEVGTVASKVRALQTDLWQFAGLRDEGTSLMINFLFASTLASYLSSLGERQAGRKAAMLGIGLVAMLEASQIFIGARMPGLWDLAVSCVGIAAGAAIWSAAGRIIWPRLWLGVLVAATLAAAALQMLSPFHLAGSYRGFGVFPFFGYYSRTTFDTLSHVIELALLYFPLGFWMGRSSTGRRSDVLTAVLLALAIAAPIEYLQGWIDGRYADVTDVAISMAGAWLGVVSGRERTMDAARGESGPDSRDPRAAGGARSQPGRHGASRS
jgi:VanZ family protein